MVHVRAQQQCPESQHVSMQAEKVEGGWDGGWERASRESEKTRACWWREDAGPGGQTDARESRADPQQAGNAALLVLL